MPLTTAAAPVRTARVFSGVLGVFFGGGGGSVLPHSDVGCAVTVTCSSFAPSQKLDLKFQYVISTAPSAPGA